MSRPSGQLTAIFVGLGQRLHCGFRDWVFSHKQKRLCPRLTQRLRRLLLYAISGANGNDMRVRSECSNRDFGVKRQTANVSFKQEMVHPRSR